MELTRFEDLFKDVSLVCGGVYLLRSADALRFVKEHRVAGIPILGIEGFRILEGDKIQPQQEHTVDFDPGSADSHREAKAFLSHRLGQDLWFEVVAADRD